MLIEQIDHFQYQGLNGFDGWCILRIYSTLADLVVVATEPIGGRGEYLNQGVSVTNAAEVIATRVRCELGFVFSRFIEHYPERGPNVRRRHWKDSMFDECFATVTFQWSTDAYRHFWPGRPNGYRTPQWKFITREGVEAIIGQAFP
jgi:hypothetical protein